MIRVLIKRCPVSPSIGGYIQEIHAALETFLGITAHIIDGRKGELTILVDGKLLPNSNGQFPDVTDIVNAIACVTPVEVWGVPQLG